MRPGNPPKGRDMSGKLYDVTSIQNAINKELATAQSVIALAEQEGR